MHAHRDHLVQWAQNFLKARETLLRTAEHEPTTLGDNPMYVWGAAAMDGFFTDDELPQAARYIKQTFGHLPSHPRSNVFFGQIVAVAYLLACELNESKVARLVKLCGLLGYMFDVHDRTGKVVASSMGVRPVS